VDVPSDAKLAQSSHCLVSVVQLQRKSGCDSPRDSAQSSFLAKLGNGMVEDGQRVHSPGAAGTDA
jgi:hypothetical protein